MIGNTVLGTAETTIKETTSESFALISLLFCNTTTSDVGVTVHLYSGGSAGSGNTVIKNLIIGPEDTLIWTANEKIIMGPTTKLSGLASTGSAITVTWNGMEL